MVRRTVAPPDVTGILRAGALSVVEQQIDLLRPLEPRGPLRMERKSGCPDRRLVVGQIGERGPFRFDPVAHCRAGMTDACGAYGERADGEPTASSVVQLEAAGEIAQQHGKQGRSEV